VVLLPLVVPIVLSKLGLIKRETGFKARAAIGLLTFGIAAGLLFLGPALGVGSVMGVLSIILLPLVLGGIPLLAQLWNVGVQKIERSLTTIEKGEDSYLKRQLNAVNNELGNVQYELERAAAVEMVAIRT